MLTILTLLTICAVDVVVDVHVHSSTFKVDACETPVKFLYGRRD